MFDGPLYGKFSKICKHCVKCINNRILLIKKKKQAAIKFLKKDVADLLANGHDSNAFGRMERLIVEINHAWCYDMIEYYCQCILNLLPSLQKLRECPEEAMEAISTIIFAAARFSDLPELDDLRQAFTEKYGSQMEASIHSEFVEKLQKKSFSTDEKLLLMKNIAEEFSVRCDFRAFQQKKSNFTPVTSAKARTSSNNNERRSNVDSNERYGALNYLQKSVYDASGGTNVRNKDNNAHMYTELNRSENERTFTYDKSLKEEKQFTPPLPMSVMPHPNTKYKQEYPSRDKHNASIDQNRLKKDERREYGYKHKEYTIGGASSSQEKEGHRGLAMYCEESDDEEEEVMDRLLMHLSKKGASNVSSKMEGRDRAPQRRQRVSNADDRGTVSKGSSMKGPGIDDDDLVARLYALKGS